MTGRLARRLIEEHGPERALAEVEQAAD